MERNNLIGTYMFSAIYITIAIIGDQQLGVAGSPVVLPLCDIGYFYDINDQSCVLCSQCPVNEIIQQPCTASHDTICGPFYEFEFFNKGGSQNEEEKVAQDEETQRQLNLFKIESTQSSNQKSRKNSSTRDPEEQRKGPSVHDATTKWKELCYGLIAALVILAVIFAVYVIIAQIQISKLQKQAKVEVAEDKTDETVYCYSALQGPIKSPSNPRLTTTDMNRHRLLHPIYRPGQARKISNLLAAAKPSKNNNSSELANPRAPPNDYIIQNASQKLNNASTAAQAGSEMNSLLSEHNSVVQHSDNLQPITSGSRLLPVIPESSSLDDCDHVRVLYTT